MWGNDAEETGAGRGCIASGMQFLVLLDWVRGDAQHPDPASVVGHSSPPAASCALAAAAAAASCTFFTACAAASDAV